MLNRRRHLLVVLLAALSALGSAATAQGASSLCRAAPGRAGIDQYCESVPGAAGAHGLGSGQGSIQSTLAPRVVRQLRRRGAAGNGLLVLPGALHSPSSDGPAQADGLAVGWPFGIVLGVISLLLVALAAERSRRRSTPPGAST